MIQFKHEVKSNINAIKKDLNALNETVSDLSMCLQEHKKQTKTELTDLQNYFKTSQANHTRQLEEIEDGVTYIRELFYCGGTGGWRRVVYLDMTNLSNTCPSGWQLTGLSERTCGRVTGGTNTHDSATFPVIGGEYNRICGRIHGYQYSSPDGFNRHPRTFVATIDNAYIDGVSVTHGTPRKHIWSFVAGLSEDYPTCDRFLSV